MNNNSIGNQVIADLFKADVSKEITLPQVLGRRECLQKATRLIGRPKESSLEPIELRDVTIRRGVLTYPNGTDVMILHKDKYIFGARVFDVHSFMETFLKEDSKRPGFIVIDKKDPKNPWFSPENESKFSCHTFALREKLGLQVSDWIEGGSSPVTMQINPMKDALKGFFRKSFEKEAKAQVYKDMTKDKNLKEGDIIVFYDSKKDRYVHSGIIKKKGKENWCECKIGESKVVRVPIETLATEYGRISDKVQIYKFDEKRASGRPK